MSILKVSHQIPINRPTTTLLQYDALELKVFDHRKLTLKAVVDFRSKMSQNVEYYFNRSMKVIEQNINAISASDVTFSDVFAKATQTPCITNLRTMVEMTIENSGYAISNCISDVDGVATTAFRSFHQALDVYERNINVEPEILASSLIGRNIFTQGRAIVNRVTNLHNNKITTFEGYLTEITAKLNEVTGVYDEQIKILETCFKSIEAELSAAMTSVSSLLSTCQKFVHAV